ncbi:MAG TPA: HD domain-containing phosphohydrolase [Treponemataceae bacterium]|nr:HD domain-containing phosphohydrolase [Treponemataceae bacterium]
MKQKPNHKYSILIIEDEVIIRESFKAFLEDCDFKVFTAENGLVGLELLQDLNPDIVMTDLRMPEIDGLEVLQKSTRFYPHIPVIVVSGTGRIQDVVEALHLGAWDYILKPVEDMTVLLHAIKKAITRVQMVQQDKQYKAHLEKEVEHRTKELEETNRELELSRKQIIRILSQAAEYRDFETGNHFLRVGNICACIARGLGWEEKDITCLELAAPVHDIGKIGIPDDILLKPASLDPAEWEEMKRHCEYGHSILSGNKLPDVFFGETTKKTNSFELLKHAATIALYHHEKWDGTGYPSGLKGREIPVQARITAIADVFDALLSKRPYKDPWPVDKCLEHIKSQSGIHFDPEIVEVFFQNLEKINNIREHYRDT